MVSGRAGMADHGAEWPTVHGRRFVVAVQRPCNLRMLTRAGNERHEPAGARTNARLHVR